jgi:hypothetical protein
VLAEHVANLGAEAALVGRGGLLEPLAQLPIDEDRHRRRGHPLPAITLDILQVYRVRGDSAKSRLASASVSLSVQAWLPKTDSEKRRRSWPGDMTRLERLAEQAGLEHDELRAYLSAEVERRLRAQAGREWVELLCDCGEPVEVSREHAYKVSGGSMPAPTCRGCRWPGVERRAEEEAVAWVELLGDSAEELAAALAALR